ncbi:MAG: glycoside hydrolase family 70 protein [Streptococcus salivarius]
MNDSRTPWANSDYRRLNRTATNQTGTIDKSILDEQSDQTTWVVSTSYS